ncbi:hypothetical protein P4O66_021352 [Electrophorus voltai]|uniref:Reverse transcriptase/retrotransposon-derived protein RNase H-like domain-containing protein n=1 Tax=Electrophorus voltai TaxID=2609070 RepID=A0AAD9E2J9_9TELE|nr:hypothetical protein P4O66_021352 [Electrophorus voltai]
MSILALLSLFCSSQYLRFVRSFSILARPLTDMLWGQRKKIKWTSEAEEAFANLKTAFTTTPVVQQPNPEKPFMVEIDTSDVGAVLSQYSATYQEGGAYLLLGRPRTCSSAIFSGSSACQRTLSDRGPQFTSQLWHELLDSIPKFGVHANVQNCHAGMTLTPFECVLGYQPPLYPWNLPMSDQPAVETCCRYSEQVWEETHGQLSSAIAAYKTKADKRRGNTPQYEPGERVWVATKEGQAGHKGKLKASYEGH